MKFACDIHRPTYNAYYRTYTRHKNVIFGNYFGLKLLDSENAAPRLREITFIQGLNIPKYGKTDFKIFSPNCHLWHVVSHEGSGSTLGPFRVGVSSPLITWVKYDVGTLGKCHVRLESDRPSGMNRTLPMAYLIIDGYRYSHPLMCLPPALH
jgi:hypothetical protein